MASDTLSRPPFPSFTLETARQKVRMAEDGWNCRDPERVSLAYTLDSEWRNRAEFFSGREQIVQFLIRKWTKELDYRLIKELWCSTVRESQCDLLMNGTTIRVSGLQRLRPSREVISDAQDGS